VVDGFVFKKHNAIKFEAIIQDCRTYVFNRLYENFSVEFVQT